MSINVCYNIKEDHHDKKRVHLIGIGGISMSGIAEILLHRGYQVSGSDLKDNHLLTH